MTKELEIAVEKRLKGFYREALKKARQVAKKAKAQNNLDLELRALWEMIDAGRIIHPEKKDLLSSMGLRTLRLARQLGDPSFNAEACVRWATLLRTLGRHKQAIRVLKSCLRLRELGVDLELRGYALWNLAFALRMRLRLKDSRRKFLEAKKIFTRLRDYSGRVYATCGLAGVTRLLGDPSKSLSFYRQALKLFKKDRDPYGLAYANCGMANALRKGGNFKKAILHYNKSQRLYRKLGDYVNEGYVLWGRAKCFQAIEKSKKAFSDIAQAKKSFQKSQDQRGLALLSVFFGRSSPKGDKAVFREAQLS